MKVIEIEGLNKTYSNHVKALQDITFSVNKGEVFGLVGPDGAGKSTFFNILTTLLNPTSGKVYVLGKEIRKEAIAIRRIIGYLPGVFSLYPDLTVEENLLFFATMYKSSIEENMPLISPIWKQLLPFKDRRAGKLSGGMKQKLALCCALIHKPELLFLDEPTTGVDPVSRTEFWDILQNIKQKDISVVVSTPYMDEATRCDRIALIQNGKIIKIDTPLNIINDFKGKLFSIKVTNVFALMERMNELKTIGNYYPYGEHLHIVLYDNPDITLPILNDFLNSVDPNHGEITPIQPSIEDCFIELITRDKSKK